MTRDERQDLGIQRWKEAGYRATCLYATGFGKTTVSLKVLKRLKAKNKDLKTVIIVPTDYLKQQWIEKLIEWDLFAHTEVLIVNTAIRNSYECDLMICDEVHLFVAETFVTVFQKVKYKLLLCLTGTIDRLDGKQVLLNKYAPICDTIDLDDAIANGWVADYKQYKVFLDVDLTEYQEHHRQFLHYFSYFGFNFELALNCAIDYKVRFALSKTTGAGMGEIMVQAQGFMRHMKARKQFIYDHPKKIEIANKIIRARTDKKIITFTKSVAHAKLVCCGDIYHAKLSAKKKDAVMKAFNEMAKGVLNSCKALDVGADVQGVDTLIIISADSSSITKRQKIGRGIRKEGEKVAEVWQLVLKGTVEEEWYRKSSVGLKTTTIDEKQLDYLLNNQEIDEEKVHKETKFMFRF